MLVCLFVCSVCADVKNSVLSVAVYSTMVEGPGFGVFCGAGVVCPSSLACSFPW